MVMLEKVADRGFLIFWPLENELPQKIWNLAKSEYHPPRHHWAAPLHSSCTACHLISNKTTTDTSTKPWTVQTYQYHTSYYTDHKFPIINTNRFVIHHYEYYLCLNWTVLFLLFHGQTCGTMFTNHNQLRMPQKKLQKNLKRSFPFLGRMKKYYTIFNGISPVKRENEPIKHWKPPPTKYPFWR